MTTPALYYADGACSLAAHITLEEIGAPFEARRIDTKAGEQRSPDYLRINPKGRVPALKIGDWVLTENPALLPFLAQRDPKAKLWPDDAHAAAKAEEWLAFIASTVHVTYAHVMRTERYATTDDAKANVREHAISSCRELWGTVERMIGDASWVMGDRYTVVDPYLLVFWTWGRRPPLSFDMAAFPRWTAHARRMAERGAVRRAFEREGIALPA